MNGLALVALGIVAAIVASRTDDGWALLGGAIVAGTFAWSAAVKVAMPGRTMS